MNRPRTPALIALAVVLSLGGCVAAIGNREGQRGTGTPGQQLIDLKKARDAGAITEAEYQTMRSRLIDVK